MAQDIYATRQPQLFPTLTQAQTQRVRTYGQELQAHQGDLLFEVGQKHTDFFVILSGKLAIVQPDLEQERVITVHEAGEFTGEVDMLSDRRSLVTGRVEEAGQFLRLGRQEFKTMLSEDSELGEIMMRAFILRRVALISNQQSPIVLVGTPSQSRTLALQQFLSRTGQPYRFLDTQEDEAAGQMLTTFGVAPEETPVVLLVHTDEVLRNPTTRQLADRAGLSGELDPAEVFDVTVVGAGPAGLSASVYAASEGLHTLTLESTAFGGQAGSSSRIENYLGFPTGVSGGALTGRALNQAQKFGATLIIPRSVCTLDCSRDPYEIHLEDGSIVKTKAVVVSTGAKYSRLPLNNIEDYEGSGVYYGATFVEAKPCAQKQVVVVGGGNSAGQAALFLSGHASHVHMLIRGDSLADSMSSYLTQRLERSDAITLHYRTSLTKLEGSPHLERVHWVTKEGDTPAPSAHDIRHVFVMIGATPNTDWLKGCLVTDEKGFIKTGVDLAKDHLTRFAPLDRPPYHLETSLPRVFAVGDVRAESVKRVASAVGEGAMSIQFVHRALAEMAQALQ